MNRLWSRGVLLIRSEGRVMLKLAVYSVMCLVVLVWLVSLIGNIKFGAQRTEYEAELDDATGLLVNDSVRIAGVEAGKVTGVDVERGHAVITFQLDDDVVLRDSSQAGVRWRNAIGQKYLYIYPGDEGEVLDSGETLPLENAVPAADVGEFLNAIGPILQAIDPDDANAFVEAVVEGVQGNEARVQRLIGNTADLSITLGDLDTEVGRVIGNVEDVVTALAERDEDLDRLVTNLVSLSTDMAARNDSLQQLVTDFTDVQTRLGQLLQDNEGNLNISIDNLVVIAQTLDEHQAALEEGLSTLPHGVANYGLISSYGEWFNVRSTITCFGAQEVCFTEDGSGSPVAAESQGFEEIVGFANQGAPTP